VKNIFISMFTNDCIYLTAVKKLIETMNKFNIDYRVYEIQDRGSWNENTDQKAEIILQAMEDYPDKNIVWLDADAVVMAEPILFNMLDCDIAYYRCERLKELRSGTLFIKNTYEMKLLVLSWIKLNQSNNIWEQRNLNSLLKNRDVKKSVLPVEYCTIYDNKHDLKNSGNPVIVHYQASRQAKAISNKLNNKPIKEIIIPPQPNKYRIEGNVKIKVTNQNNPVQSGSGYSKSIKLSNGESLESNLNRGE